MAKKQTPPAEVGKADTLKEALKKHEYLRVASILTDIKEAEEKYADLKKLYEKKAKAEGGIADRFTERLAEWAYKRYEEEQAYIIAELQKPEYDGKNLEEVEADGINEDGYILPDSLYGKAWKAAIEALNLDRLNETEKALQPYLQKELQKPEYGGRSLDDLRAEYLAGKGADSLYERAIDAADKFSWESSDLFKELTNPPITTIKRADSIEYPLDKVNTEMWRLLEKDTGGQIAFKAEKDGSKHELNIYYSINFDLQGVTITKKLEPFDKRVYIAVSALFNAGNNVITLTQIHYAMGNSKRPSKQQLQKIYDSVRKMTGARVFVNNEDEAKVYQNYPVFKYEGSLLPLESLSAIVNGQLTNAAIHIFREPPIVSFARQRNQLTTVKTSLLDSPISKTNGNLAIDDYLIERIARAKNGKQPCKILYETLYERCRLTTAKQRQRAPETIKRYLDHYKTEGFITGYKQAADSVTIFYADKEKGPAGTIDILSRTIDILSLNYRHFVPNYRHFVHGQTREPLQIKGLQGVKKRVSLICIYKSYIGRAGLLDSRRPPFYFMGGTRRIFLL